MKLGKIGTSFRKFRRFYKTAFKEVLMFTRAGNKFIQALQASFLKFI